VGVVSPIQGSRPALTQPSCCAPYDARAVANFILDLGDLLTLPVTQLQLQKTLYFAHGWYLAQTNKPLVRQNFEAWKHGPVVKVVWDSFKDSGSQPISTRATRKDLSTGIIEEVVDNIAPADQHFVRDMFRTYCPLNGWTLSEMSHIENGPWRTVWQPDQPIGRLGLRIRNDEIRRFFLLGGEHESN
jgi:uncharacterized phage-associated protein